LFPALATAIRDLFFFIFFDFLGFSLTPQAYFFAQVTRVDGTLISSFFPFLPTSFTPQPP